MLTRLQSIPTIFKGLMLGFLVVLTIRITYPIANHILAMFTAGTMIRYAAIIAYWLIIIFVTWFLLWIMILEKKEKVSNNG